MQYLKPNVCKQLEALGLVSESGKYWYFDYEALVSLFDRNPPIQKKKWLLKDYDVDGVQAFIISDILLNADNARKLWGEDECSRSVEGYSDCCGCNSEIYERGAKYQIECKRLLDLVLSGTDIEPELQKAIESKPL